MSGFVRRQLSIGGDRQPLHQYKVCNKCEEAKPPEGGVQMSPNRWHCALCWTKRITIQNLNGERR